MTTLKSLAAATLGAVALAFAATAQAQATNSSNLPAVTTDNRAGAAMTDGEVRKIDKENLKITLKHGDIRNLDMPGMTMVFKVKDAALLDNVQVGGAVRFAAEKSAGALVVTAIEALR